jgi:CPA2 family monovalent cation:H+ antiporter-2
MVTTLIFLVVRQFGPKNVPGFRTGLLFLSLLFTLPFIWAMSFGHREPTNHSRKRIEVLPLLLTLILTGVLSSLFISWKLTLPLTVILLICAFSLSLKRLEHSYGWFEEKFLESFTSSSRHKEASFQHLVPWNGHLVTLKIHPNAQHVGKTLAEVHFRSVYGINIVAIRRGVQNIIAPGPQELLLPADDLVVLGTDENIERLRQEIENVSIKTEEAPQDFELRHLQVSDVPGLVGQTIRHSNIRERFHILILGIEREGKRVTTPAADEELKADDQLWLVGARGDLSQFIKDGLKN